MQLAHYSSLGVHQNWLLAGTNQPEPEFSMVPLLAQTNVERTAGTETMFEYKEQVTSKDNLSCNNITTISSLCMCSWHVYVHVQLCQYMVKSDLAPTTISGRIFFSSHWQVLAAA